MRTALLEPEPARRAEAPGRNQGTTYYANNHGGNDPWQHDANLIFNDLMRDWYDLLGSRSTLR